MLIYLSRFAASWTTSPMFMFLDVHVHVLGHVLSTTYIILVVYKMDYFQYKLLDFDYIHIYIYIYIYIYPLPHQPRLNSKAAGALFR